METEIYSQSVCDRKKIERLFGDLCVSAQDPTAAGIRQQLNSHARAMIVDECEQKVGSTRAEDILELARLSSSVDSGSILRGSARAASVNSRERDFAGSQ